MSGRIEGRVIRLGHDINTDLILPGAYLNMVEPKDLGKHLLETYDAEVGRSVQPGDIFVAGRDFGGGSSREQAPVAMLARGVQAVIAVSFARIFMRNALNVGLPVLESPAAWEGLENHEHVVIDPGIGAITSSSGAHYSAPAQPPFIRDLIARGGLVPWVREQLRQNQQ
jgi:3-isopropylmalate/(R)-2-methylmalate dehydratase small subunit